MAHSPKSDGKRPSPRPDRRQFEEVVKKLLTSPPVPMEEVQRRRKGQKKLGKVLPAR